MNSLSTQPHVRHPPPVPRSQGAWPVLVSVAVLVAGLALTTVGVVASRSAFAAETYTRLGAHMDRLASGLEGAVSLTRQALIDTRAMYAVTGGLDRGDFQTYLRARELQRHIPDLRSIGMIESVAPDALGAWLARERQDGASEFSLRRAPAPGSLLVVRHAQPARSGWASVGVDIRSEPVPWQAARQALDSARAVLSAPIDLGPAGGQQKGWVLMVPAVSPDSAQPERLFFATLGLSELMQRLQDAGAQLVRYQLFDGGGAGRGPAVFDSGAGEPAQAEPARFALEQPLLLGGRELSLRVEARPELELAPGHRVPWIVGTAGTLLSLLLALACWLYLSAQGRARRIAMDMTGDLQRMARVVERTSSAVFGLDLDGRITWANLGFERLTGLPAADCVGRLATELPEIAGADPASRRKLRTAIAQRAVRRLELLNQMREGVRYWTDTELLPTRDGEGRINGFICIASDITRRKLAELRLRDSEHLMRVIADNLPARVSYWDSDRRCRFVNRRFCEEFGRSPDELKGQALSSEFFGQDFYERLQPYVEQVLRGEPQHFDYQAEDAAARSAWQLHCIPDTEAGQVRGFFVLALDVTELRQARDVAVQASQSKSRFLSSMSHEIRTPLNAVLGMLALLRATRMDNRQRDYADKADRAARSLLSLLNDVLDLSKIEAGKMALAPRPFAVDELLRDLSVVFAGNVGSKELEVLFDVDPRLPPQLVADDLRLRQVLINLGGNAIKFTERGQVLLRLRVLERADERVRLEVSVSDTGMGIAPDERSRIFGEFGQAQDSTARNFGGTGLGLGICQRLLELMGSRLELESEPGRGSRFWFELTLPVGPAPAAAPQPEIDLPRKVLIVDDSAEARDSLGAMARSLGWTVDLAASGAEALRRIEQAAPGAAYDALFIDWRMPDMDGWQTSLEIRRMPSAARAPLMIMVTAHGREMLGQRPAHEQALLDGFLVKPVTATMLRDALLPVPAAPAESAAPLREQPLAGVRLLLVEDNLINQELAVELLASQGAQVEVACNGRAGLDRIREGADRFDAVLMDVLMPEMDGYTATRAVREQLQNWRLPIIAMTANAMESDRVDCLAAGMNDHVAKPFGIDDLVQTLLRHIRRPVVELADAAQAKALAAADSEVNADFACVLDRASAVNRLGGDDALYERLVPRFAESLSGIAARLPTLLDSVPQPEAERLMHSLKGTAATMGAARLAAAAAEAERLLSQQAPRHTDAEMLRAVARAIDHTLLALSAPGQAST